MSLPAEVGLCTIRGRYLSARLEGADQEGVPLTGLTATFTPTLRPPMLKAAGSTPPVSILVAPVMVRSNADGVLVGDDGSTDTTLIASDYPDPENPWTYRVNIVGPGFAPQEFYIVAPTGGVLDLTEVLEAPSGTGFDLSAWSALVVRAETARADAESARAAAVAAQTAAEAVPAQVDTAMAAVGADPESEFAIQQSATIDEASAKRLRDRAAVLASQDQGFMHETLPGSSVGPLAVLPDFSVSVTGEELLGGRARILGADVRTGIGWDGAQGTWRDTAIKSGGRAIQYGEAGPFTIEFDFTEDRFYLQKLETAASMDVWADNIYVGHYAEPGPATGEAIEIPVVFSDARRRTIRLQFGDSGYIKGIRCTNAASVSYPSVSPAGAAIVFCSDSFGEGGSATKYSLTMVPALNRLGWMNIENSSSGGSGYLAAPAGRPKLRDRLDADVLSRDPDLVIIALGFNDNAFTPAQVADEAELTWSQILSYASQPRLVVFGPWDTPDDAGVIASQTAIDTALVERAASLGVTYHSPYREGWAMHNRTKYVVGNVLGDPTHPNDAGYLLLNSWLAAHLLG